MLGNASENDSRKLAAVLESKLRLEQPLSIIPEEAEAKLPAGSTLWTMDSSDKDDPNNAVILRLQLGRTVEERALLLVTAKVLSSKFFDLLRTQQQLGYIVALGSQAGMSFNYLTAQVQTEFNIDYVRGRIDAFFAEHFAWIEDRLSEEEFQTCRQGVLSELRTKPKNLAEEYSIYSGEFLHRSYDFERRERSIAFLESDAFTICALRSFLRDMVRSAPRLYIQVKKVLDREDKPLPPGAVIPQDPPSLRRWEGHEAGLNKFKEIAESLSIDRRIS